MWKMLNYNVKDSNKGNESNKNDNLGRDNIQKMLSSSVMIQSNKMAFEVRGKRYIIENDNLSDESVLIALLSFNLRNQIEK